jgi:hypothetical protein
MKVDTEIEYKGVVFTVSGTYSLNEDIRWVDCDISVGGVSLWEVLPNRTVDYLLERAERKIAGDKA